MTTKINAQDYILDNMSDTDLVQHEDVIDLCRDGQTDELMWTRSHINKSINKLLECGALIWATREDIEQIFGIKLMSSHDRFDYKFYRKNFHHPDNSCRAVVDLLEKIRAAQKILDSVRDELERKAA